MADTTGLSPAQQAYYNRLVGSSTPEADQQTQLAYVRGLTDAQASASMGALGAKPSLRELAEASGIKIDYSDPTTQQKLMEVSNALYGDVGANMDARDWNAIMASSNPLQAAKDGLKQMYSDPNYLRTNAENLISQGYVPEQADYTYRQMQERVGSTYDPNWTSGTRFQGIDTDGYVSKVRSFGNDAQALSAFQTQQLARWQGSGTGLVTGGGSGVVDTGGTGTLAGGAGTTGGTPNSGSQTAPAASPVYGPDGTAYSSPAAAIAAGVTNFTYSKPAGPGLISGADTLSNTFMAPNLNTGNVNSGGLITGANQQLFNVGAPKVSLPPGVRNPFQV